MNGSVTVTGRGPSLTIFPVENGYVVRDAHMFSSDPLQASFVGTWVFKTAQELSEAIAELLEPPKQKTGEVKS